MEPWIKTLKEFLIEYEALEHFCNGLYQRNTSPIEGTLVSNIIDKGITWSKTAANYGNPKRHTWSSLDLTWERRAKLQFQSARIPSGMNRKALADALRAPSTPTAKLLKHVRNL